LGEPGCSKGLLVRGEVTIPFTTARTREVHLYTSSPKKTTQYWGNCSLRVAGLNGFSEQKLKVAPEQKPSAGMENAIGGHAANENQILRAKDGIWSNMIEQNWGE